MAISNIKGVFCCGNISFDIPVWPVEKFAWGTTTWVETIAESVGGNGGNTSYALGTLGVPVRLCGMVGRDPHGDWVLARLRESGVDIRSVGRCDVPTNVSICVVHPSADRLFLHRLGASTAVTADSLTFADPDGYSHFHLANLFSLPNLRPRVPDVLRRAKALGLTTSLDTGWDARGVWMPDLAPCLPHIDLLFLNESEAGNFTGSDDPVEAAGILRDSGARDIVLKLGAAGSIVFPQGQQPYRAAAFAVQALDTTGAGDCYAGGFLAALHRGFSYAEAAVFANAVGAMKVEMLGAAQGVKSFEETRGWIAQAKLVG
ncbi:MAG TPA: carbohydrate kinase family protein [Bryobacteraceae bacterium]|nr:carbohydrate kinase family protein [Bryobacteraceae bacterium]